MGRYITKEVDIYVDDVVEKLSNEEIQQEAKRRALILGPVTSDREKRQYLIQAADKLRDIGMCGLAFRLDELREELGI